MTQDWNNLYATGETPWDRGAATPVLEAVRQVHPRLFHGRVLVPGCGLGHDARWLAEQGCDVTGLDIAPLALERARTLDTGHRVDFRLENLFDLPAELRGSFDMVWEHTCLCALDLTLRPEYIAAVRSALKPDGIVAGVFYMNPDLDPGETGPPFGILLEDLIKLWKGGGFEVEEHWVPDVAYEGRQGRERYMRLKKMRMPKRRRAPQSI